MKKEAKKLFVQKFSEKLTSRNDFFIFNYQGLKASEINELRNKLKTLFWDCYIVKNSLIGRVLEKTELNNFSDFIQGPTGIIINRQGNILEAIKLLVSFSKENKALQLRAGFSKTQVFTVNDIFAIASLPERNVIEGQLVTILYRPLVQLIELLQYHLKNLIFGLKSLINKKESTN